MAVTVVAVWSSGSAVGSLASGFLAERYTIRKIISAAFLLAAVGYLLLLRLESTPAVLLWGLYFGLVQGGSFTLQQVIFADYYGRDSLGAVRGVVWPVQSAANAGGPLAASLAYDATGGYELIFSLFVVATLASAVCIFFAKPPRPKAPAGAGPRGP